MSGRVDVGSNIRVGVEAGGHSCRDLEASSRARDIGFRSGLSPYLAAGSLLKLFLQTKTDYMLTARFNPQIGWEAPEIRPYANLELDPMSSCFQYCPNVFEGMKVC